MKINHEKKKQTSHPPLLVRQEQARSVIRGRRPPRLPAVWDEANATLRIRLSKDPAFPLYFPS